MIEANEIAVCVSGLAREGYKEALQIAKKVFPYATFYMQWKGYPKPDVPNCLLIDEPVYDYHNLLDTKTKPNCPVWTRYTKKPNGKIFRRSGLLEKTKNNSKQIIAHYRLVKSLPSKYKTIIKFRYDTLLSTKVNFAPFIERAQNGEVIGFSGSVLGKDVDSPLKELGKKNWYLLDHMIFHPREKLQNIDKLFQNKNLLGAEWGWYQVLCHHQYSLNDNNFMNVEGGNVLTTHVKK